MNINSIITDLLCITIVSNVCSSVMLNNNLYQHKSYINILQRFGASPHSTSTSVGILEPGDGLRLKFTTGVGPGEWRWLIVVSE